MATTEKPNDIQSAILAGKIIADKAREIITTESGEQYLLVPDDMQLKRVESLSRIKTDHTLTDIASFIDYLNRFKTDSSIVFANANSTTLEGIIDYHKAGPNKADWGEHTVGLDLKRSTEWTTWSRSNKQSFNQEGFANFLEDNLPDILEPDAALLQEAITKIKLVRTQTTNAVRNLSNGTVQLAYIDEEKQSEGTTQVPTRIVVGLRPFTGSKPMRISARLRYSLKQGNVTFMYLMDQLERAAEDSFALVCDQVAEATGLPVLMGTP